MQSRRRFLFTGIEPLAGLVFLHLRTFVNNCQSAGSKIFNPYLRFPKIMLRKINCIPLVVVLMMITLPGCKYFRYSFKEGSIPADVKSISIGYIQNSASVVVPALSQQLTDKLRQKYLAETRLDIVKSDGDYDIKGTITNYVAEPVSLQAGQKSAQNQLKITVQVQFVNKRNPKGDFDESFTQFAEFGSDKSLTSVEVELIGLITDKLTQAIFNKTLSDW